MILLDVHDHVRISPIPDPGWRSGQLAFPGARGTVALSFACMGDPPAWQAGA